MSTAVSAPAIETGDAWGFASVDAAPSRDVDRAGPSPRLLAELSHDLRTPLASVRLIVRALRDGLLEPERRDDYLARIEQQVSLLTELVDELHAVAREQAGPRKWRTEWVSPQRLIREAADTMRIQAEATGVVLEIDAAPCLPLIRANTIELQRTLLNLLENAIRHARAGGRVRVHAEPAPGGLEIEVEDDGKGIAVEEHDHVFSAFVGADQRGSPSRSGLGLSIARSTVEAHGGRIWLVDSTSGTRVRLWLPAATERRIPRTSPQTPDHSLPSVERDDIGLLVPQTSERA
jgi:signal transduction histidine kinase